ncbi:Immunoglobulin E-set [Penicillium robsamsonii]|uniref:Immunoglobulin E-set n=1 Tax=Penicillium robsamsonii TaxID=1792511 RepID=UPI002547B701|nr:Immunoglobulin E-set [Penicillium robsamsonii]KAJ5826957.1 Immunoglobulin E-set [Penicillium robsamsonii]
MGTFTFQWPHTASEVFVTGTFDDWGKTVKLDRVGDIFTKEVTISPVQKVHYKTLPGTPLRFHDYVFLLLTEKKNKFVVDGIWTTNPDAREEEDGHNNVNNVLLPEEINTDSAPTMSGVTPDSTTAALAANVPKEPNGNLPGAFPETPGLESEQTLSVDPIPASEGYGNPVSLNPGEKVPHHSTLHNNTVDSTVTLDKESYEKGQTLPIDGIKNTADTGASPYTLPPITNNMIPESSLPIGGPAQRAASEAEPIYTGGPVLQAALADPGYNIQSAGPDSTTAALAAAVPLEPKGKETNGDKPVDEVPQVVKDSLTEAHKDPEAAAYQESVDEKKAIEEELHKKVQVDESAGTPAPTVTAATQAVAPHLTVASGIDSADVSPLSTPAPGRTFAAAAPTSAPKTESSGPTVTTGPETTSTAETSTPKAESAGPTVTTGVESAPAPATSTAEPAGPAVTTGVESSQAPATSTAKPAEQPRNQSHSTEGASSNGDKKKKRRMSSFFSKLKEKLK